MKPFDPARVAAAYLRLIHLGKWLSCLPLRPAYRLAAWAAARYSPFRDDYEKFARYARAVGLAESALAPEWNRVMARHGMFFVNTPLHAGRARQIADRVPDGPPEWQRLMAERQGALVLTCHHDFHHTLFVLAGLAGRRVSVVAAPDDSGPLAPWLTPHIRRQHADCARHFNGGRYLFTGPGQARAIVTALKNGEVVFSLHDFVQAGKHSRPARLFGRAYSVPVGTIEIALRLGVPIYFAMLVWSDERFAYRIECQRLNVTSEQPLDAYASALESVVAAQPSAWHGWQWFDIFSSVSHPPLPPHKDSDRS
jgi:lauroyl/myristoyl acyltransferase